jgi:hypothetical protein
VVADAVIVERVSALVSVVIREKNSEKSKICSETPSHERYLALLSGVYPGFRKPTDQGIIAI